MGPWEGLARPLKTAGDRLSGARTGAHLARGTVANSVFAFEEPNYKVGV
jgi:hypothetical protein